MTEETQGEKSPSAGSIVGLIMSSVGAVGWATVLVLFEPYAEHDAVRNFFTFGLNAFLLVAGGGTSTVLAFAGFVSSSVSNSHERSTQATIGTVLGLLGMITGVAVFAWRWNLVFGS